MTSIGASATLQPPVEIDDGATVQTLRPTSRTGWDAFGNPISVQDPNGNLTTTTYDRLDRRIRVDHPAYTPPGGATLTPSETFAYDAVGNLTATTSRRGFTTTFVYDTLNRAVHQIDPAVNGATTGGVTTTEYDAVGNITATVDPTGARIEHTHDGRDRTVTTTQIVRPLNGQGPPAQHTTQFDYDDLDNLTVTTDPTGAVTVDSFDVAANHLSHLDADGHTWTFTHDLADRPVTATDPTGRATTTNYDPAGRAITHTHTGSDSSLLVTTHAYDPAGNRTTTTSPQGRTVASTWDAANRLTAVTVAPATPDAHATTYGYDAAGNHTRTTDGNGNTTRYGYNSWNLQTSVTEPATAQHPDLADRTYTIEFDAGGLPTTERHPGAIQLDRTYDELGRLTIEQANGPDTPAAARTFGYDLAGRHTTLSHPDGAIHISHDDRGLPRQVDTPASPTTTYTYDSAARPTSRTDANGTHTFTWTPAGQLATATDALTGSTATHTHDPAGRLLSVDYATAPGRRDLTYDSHGRPATDTLTGPGSSPVGELCSNLGPLLGGLACTILGPEPGPTHTLAYTYDHDGHLLTATIDSDSSAAGIHTYTFDDAGRLTSWQPPSGPAVQYGYDAAGNRTDVSGLGTFTYDQRNRLVATPDDTRTHTPRGTLDTVTPTTGTPATYTFDALGRMTGLDHPNGPIQATYDALNRLAHRNGTDLVYAGTAKHPIHDGTTATVRTPDGTLLAIDNGTTVRRAGLNRHGDLAYTYTDDGTLTGARTYDPWGQPVATTGTMPTTIGFQTDYTDPTSGEVWMGARWYQPDTATFTSRDTWAGELATPVTLNRYTYAANNPLTYFDPDGHTPQNVHDGTGWGVADRNRTHNQAASGRAAAHTSGTSPQSAAAAIPETAQILAGREGLQASNLTAAPTPWGTFTHSLSSTLIGTFTGTRDLAVATASRPFRGSSAIRAGDWNQAIEIFGGENWDLLAGLGSGLLETSQRAQRLMFPVIGLAQAGGDVDQATHQLADDLGAGSIDLVAILLTKRTFAPRGPTTTTTARARPVAPRPASGAESAAQGARLREHLRLSERYGTGAVRELPDGRIRYYGELRPANKPGEMAGLRVAREWDPGSGNYRTWMETLDHSGRVRQVHPYQPYSEYHYMFDEFGNYVGRR